MHINNNKGLSLIEIMVAVALTSILAGVAIPSYRSYTYESKTAEARTTLSQIYMAEKAFELRWRFYANDLLVIGVFPDGPLLYNAGFRADIGIVTPPSSYTGQELTTRNNLWALCGNEFEGSGFLESCAFKNDTLRARGNGEGGFRPPHIPTEYSSVTTRKFKIVAIGDVVNIRPKDPSNILKKGIDIWTINNYKEIRRIKKWNGDPVEVQ